MDSIATIAGWLLILWALAEVFIEVLFPRALSPPLGSLLCRVAQRIAAGLWRGGAGWQRKLTSLVGPLLVITQILSWGLLLWLGFALIAWPRMGDTIVASGQSETPTDFFSAMYVMGYGLTTLGVGDLVPKSSGMRILFIAEAAVGFSVLTLVMTYLMSVYGAIAERNRIALLIDTATGGSGDPYEYLRESLWLPHETKLRTEDELADALIAIYESHQFYPVLHYFRFPEPAYLLPRMLYFSLEVATVAEVIRATEGEASGRRFTASSRLWPASNQLLTEAASNFSRRRSDGPRWDVEIATLRDYLQRWQAVQQRQDVELESLVSQYQELRERWLAPLQTVARSQGAERMLVEQLARSARGEDSAEP
ncbi:potassium channel family protein [Candidatus Laterigemmans baculatus]|uniref:potassium channel family protein n=1 Tax=Candidatus Laterigemmans baculatus TaxID=2770505 RepID=UPI0013DD589D|nr:potassium channel family protein [Candidatus Laterigemmans baculatus]